MNRLVLSLAAAGSLALASPALAAPTKYYFGCVGPTKVQNAEAEAWSTTAPSASFQSGAGCGSADLGALSGREDGVKQDFYAGGKHTGAIEAINVEVHSLLLTRLRARPDPGLQVELIVDGEDVLGGPADFRVEPVLSSTGLTEAYRFSIANPAEFDEEGNELPRVPLVSGTGEHTISLRFSPRFLDYQNIWVWGATEVPGHVEINPATLTAPTVGPVG